MATVTNPSYRKRISYHATLLGGMGLFAASLLVMVNIATEKDIALRLKEDMQFSLQQAIPPENYNNDLFEDTKTIKTDIKLQKNNDIKVYLARMDEKIVAAAFESTGIGYAGPINIIMGVNSKGVLLGVRVINHSETPGLGDKIEVKKDNWITRFTGLSLSNPAEEKWKVKKDGGQFDQFTGATITPRAVVTAIKNGLLFFSHNKHIIFSTKDEQNKNTALIKKYENMSAAEIKNMINHL